MILFLDIDGVIVTCRSHFSTGRKGLMEEPDPIALKAIVQFCLKLGAQIVLSSAWRTMAGTPEALEQWGLKPYLHPDWRTAYLPGNGFMDHLHNRRGREIQDWLTRHPETGEDYVILEDEPSDLLPEQKKPEHLIHCDIDEGMTSENIRTLMTMAGFYPKKGTQ